MKSKEEKIKDQIINKWINEDWVNQWNHESYVAYSNGFENLYSEIFCKCKWKLQVQSFR